MTLTTSGATVVDSEELYAASRRVIALAVDDLWPDRNVVIGPQSPSITSYVCPVTVDGVELFAKYGWLSTSLVSILRGARGTMAKVMEVQEPYTRSRDSVTRREYQHLEALREIGRPRVADTAGFRAGVLLTHAVPGTTIAEEIIARPWDTSALLDTVLVSLRDLHSEAGAGYLRGAWPIDERNIVDIFRRKFTGPNGPGYIAELGCDSGLEEAERLTVVDLVGNTVRRLWRLAVALPSRQQTAVFGDLKPEHVFLGSHRLTFIDPALQWAAGPQPDMAKLCGRALLLALDHHELRAEQQIMQGVMTSLNRYFAALPKAQRADALRETMILLLMDTTNYLASCLSAPPGCPLSVSQRTLLSQGCRVAQVVERASGLLIGSMTGPDLIDAIFSEVEHTTWGRR
ncbi:hypothetical protein ACFV2V_02230 [Streptomyces sp. NPDC059698]|uniref:hypothetical protein n=1 Tax=unclassified Streptomyces TaxID=2593676 RepID=UPI00093AE739|nr:hypothetical protein [Streptomyces sp. CB02366]OKJ41200.1 hypothetical protein AMK24_04960 [Streptomyces sp. CB02366]